MFGEYFIFHFFINLIQCDGEFLDVMNILLQFRLFCYDGVDKIEYERDGLSGYKPFLNLFIELTPFLLWLFAGEYLRTIPEELIKYILISAIVGLS